LLDPCEKEHTDVLDCLNPQQREEITESAQMALRMVAFKNVYKVLGMDCIASFAMAPRVARKRPHTSSGSGDQQGK
jgi:hypothetical protein